MDRGRLHQIVRRATGRIRPLVLLSGLLVGCAAPRPGAPAPVAVAGPDTATVVLMSTTDLHGRLVNHDYYTGQATDHGLAVLKPVIDSIRSVHGDRTLLFDSGDLLQGNPLALVYARQYAGQPNPIIRAMNLLDYDAAAIGNHEYNYGLEHLRRAAELARFPFLSANTFRAGTDQHAYSASVMLHVMTPAGDSIRIGVTGNTPPGVHVWDRDNVEGVLEFRDVVESVASEVERLRRDGADVVVVLSHGGFGGTSYDMATTGLPPENQAAEMAEQIPGIDVIFMGHTHREVADTTINGVLLSQARNWGMSLAVATLRLQRTGGAWRIASRHAEILRPAREPDRAFVDSLRWEHERTVAWVNGRVGTARAPMPAREGRVRDVAVIDFVNEVQRRAAGTQLSSTAAFSIEASLPAGEITIADVAALYPYDNTLKAIRINGAQLRAYLERSATYYAGWPPAAGGTVTNFSEPGYNFDIVAGVEYALDISRPVGERVVRLQYEGRDVRKEDMFTLALNNYRQAGGGGYDMIADAEVIYDRQEDIRDLLIEEVRRRGTIDPADYFTQSWELLPAAAADSALREQTSREIRAARGDAGTTNAGTTDAGNSAAATSDAPPAAARPRLRVLSTNDFHGHLDAPSPSWAGGRLVGGAAVIASYFRHEAEAFDGAVLLLDGGDVLQGTPLSNLTQGRATVDFFNLVGYDGAAIGNHEFDWGTDVLRERIRDAQFAWLGANIAVSGSDTTPSWIRATSLIERDGVTIGLVGLATLSTPTTTAARNVEGLTFLDGAETMDRHVAALRAAGADFVIVLAHAGAFCAEDATTCRGELIDWVGAVRNRPDLVIGGHTNAIMRTRVNGVAVMESGHHGLRYGVADLERVSEDSVDVWMRGTPVTWADVVQPDSAAAALVRAAQDAIGPQVRRRIATAARAIPRGAALGQLIADAQRAATDADVAIMNAGGVRADLPAGEVTWTDLYQVHPFGNTLVVLELRGSDLLAALEHALSGGQPQAWLSGVTVRWESTRPPGSRILAAVLTDGQRVEAERVYTVVANDFMANGIGDGYTALGRALSVRPTSIVDLDALIEHVQSLPQPFSAPTASNWIDTGGRD